MSHNPYATDQFYQFWASYPYAALGRARYEALLSITRHFPRSYAGKWIHAFFPEVEIVSLEEFFKMAKYGGIEFANIEISSKDEKEVDALLNDGDFDVWQAVSNLVADGYRISLAYNPNSDSVIASLTATERAAHNQGLCLTSHAGDGYSAITLAYYKHYKLANGGDWTKAAKQQSKYR